MATVTGFTADRMLAIENGTVVDGSVVGDNLILTTKGGTNIDAGNVRGPAGGAAVFSRYESNVTFSVPNSVWTNIPTWARVTGAATATVTAGGVFKVTVDGLYQLNASAMFEANSVGRRIYRITVNGTMWRQIDVKGDTYTQAQVVDTIPLTTTDSVEFQVYQTSGAARNINGGTNASVMTILKLPS